MRRLRRLRTRAPRRPPDLRRAVRAAAPWPGVGGHGGQRRRDDHGRQGHGPRHQRVRRPHAWPRSQGTSAIGHTRYSTTGSSTWRNAQPVYRAVGEAGFALGHNGNLTNTAALAAEAGMLPGMVDHRQRPRRRAARRRATPARSAATGATSSTALHAGAARAWRAPSRSRSWTRRTSSACATRTASVRCVSAGSPEGWVLASETPALDVVGAHFVREIDPGEMIVIDANGVRSLRSRSARIASTRGSASSSSSTSPGPTACSTARRCTAPAAAWANCSPSSAPVEADMVMGVPESGVPAAEGYAAPQRHPVRPGPGEEPLHRPHVHLAGPGRPRAAACAASSTR